MLALYCFHSLTSSIVNFYYFLEQAQQIRPRDGVKRFLEVVELREEEKQAAQEDVQKIEENIEHTAQFPPPSGLQQRPKGEKTRYIRSHRDFLRLVPGSAILNHQSERSSILCQFSWDQL